MMRRATNNLARLPKSFSLLCVVPLSLLVWLLLTTFLPSGGFDMSIRFNALWRGKRTTVRIPGYLVRLHKLVVGFETDEQVIDDLRLALEHSASDSACRHLTASQVCSDYVMSNVEDALSVSEMPPSRSKASKQTQTIL